MQRHFLASLLLHLAVLVALIFLPPPTAPEPLKEEAVDVEIVAVPKQPQRTTTATRIKPIASEPHVQSPLGIGKDRPPQRIIPAPRVEPDPNALIAAKNFYAASLLADRHNKSAREAMKTLAADERMIQLCNIEAMEQVRRARPALKPDYVIAYAMADLKLSAHGMDAGGAAFLSHRNWFGLKFRCDVSADDSTVVSFAYRVGEPIPKSEWAAHNLTADASSAD